jgi:hypothetical protein
VPRPDGAIVNSWRAFCDTIKYERRYFFLQYENRQLQDQIDQDEAEFTIPELLDKISRYAARSGLFVRVEAGTEFVRAQRKLPQDPPFSPRRMGPPPPECARQPNRMSPAGVSMFYGAEHESTALAEIANGNEHFALGWFALARDLQLLDLRKTPDVPSLFDLERAADRPFALFMREFIQDFRRPISRDGLEHIEYVPTQVVTEYFNTCVRHHGRPIDGILYQTTKLEGGTSVVLFANNAAVREWPSEPREVGNRLWAGGDQKTWLVMTRYSECNYRPNDPAALGAATI